MARIHKAGQVVPDPEHSTLRKYYMVYAHYVDGKNNPHKYNSWSKSFKELKEELHRLVELGMMVGCVDVIFFGSNELAYEVYAEDFVQKHYMSQTDFLQMENNKGRRRYE